MAEQEHKLNYVRWKFGGKHAELPANSPGKIGNHWSKGRFYEQALLRRIRKQQVGGTYVDCGMNIGNHTLFFARLCPSIRVISFEPYPSNLRRAERLLEENGVRNKVLAVNAALSDQAGKIDLAIRNRAITSLSLRLDDFALDDLTVLKVDVEGAELQVLKGAKETLERCRPALYVEIFDESYDEVSRWLEGIGYRKTWKFSTPTYEFLPKS